MDTRIHNGMHEKYIVLKTPVKIDFPALAIRRNFPN